MRTSVDKVKLRVELELAARKDFVNVKLLHVRQELETDNRLHSTSVSYITLQLYSIAYIACMRYYIIIYMHIAMQLVQAQLAEIT